MKLVISAGPVRPANLTVINGDAVIITYQVYGGDIKQTIDRIFKERYIEAVHFEIENEYTQKFIDYIEEKYKGVEIL